MDNLNQNPDMLESISKKYPRSQYRKIFRYFHSGIPEKYWSDDFSFIGTTDKRISKLEKDKNLYVQSNSIQLANLYVADYLKKELKGNERCMYYDFFGLMSKLVGKFNEVNEQVLFSLTKLTVIGITNITYGDMLDKYSKYLISLLSFLDNHSFNRKIILSIEGDANAKDETVEKAYGDLFIYLKNNSYNFVKFNKVD